MFWQQVLKSFWAIRFYFYLFSRVGKIKEKESLWGNCFWSSYLFHSCIFPKCFSLWFIFQTPCVLTLELSYLSYLLGSCFGEKIVLWFSETTKSCIPSFIWVCCYPSCVEAIVEEVEFVGIPLSVEVIEVGVLAFAYPSKCRGDCCCLT